MMSQALRLAQSGKGRTFPNPSVGAVLCHQGVRVACVRTADGGRPHAETQSLQQAAARGITLGKDSTLYVTLAPCSHHGQTPPCVEAIVDAGIGRVVIGVDDSDSRVRGQSEKFLKDAGTAVEMQGLDGRIADFYHGYLRQRAEGSPHVALKIASGLDGRIALKNGQSQWITGMPARRVGHWLRSRTDAVMTGAGTVRADDPQLDCRMEGFEAHSPMKIITAGKADLPVSAKIFQKGEIIVIAPHASQKHLCDVGGKLTIIEQNDAQDRIDMRQALEDLAARGITDILVEAGAGLNTALLQEDLVDRIYYFQSPKLMGADALAAVGALGLTEMTQTQSWHVTHRERCGEDMLHVLDKDNR